MNRSPLDRPWTLFRIVAWRGLLWAGLLVGMSPVSAQEAPAVSETGRVFEIADFYRAAAVGGQDVSPDGGTAVITVTRFRLEEGESTSRLWFVSLGADSDEAAPRQMTFGEVHDHSPSFSPDGRALLFVSDREGGEELWRMAVDGGEPRRLTDFAMDLRDPVWSPDGRWIAVTAGIYPECGADSDCNEEIRSRWEDGPLNAHMADELLYRHWTSWADGLVDHVLLVDAESGEVVRDLTPGEWASPTFSLGDGPGYAFSPDGQELVFVSNHDEDPSGSTNADLWSVPLAVDADERESSAPEAANLSGDNQGWDFGPLYSPDGRYLAYRSMETAGYEADFTRVAALDRKSGAVRYLTENGTGQPPADALEWLPDSSGLILQASEQGRHTLYRLDLASGEATKLFTHSSIDSWQLVGKDRVVYVSRAIDAPTELWTSALDGSQRRRLTHFNRELEEEVDLRPPEELWLPGDGGQKIHVFLIKPHGFDPTKKYPLILNVHGGPQGQWMDNFRGDWQVYPGKGYVLAFANPTGSTGYGQELTDAIACDWGGRVYRDLMAVADGLEKLPYVDKDRVGVMGWSYGGYMVMWMAGQTDRFEALAAMMGLYDLDSFYGATEELWFPDKDLCGQPWNSEHYRKWSPSEHAAKFQTPSLVITGEKDYRVPYTQSLQFFTALRKQDVPARLVVFPDAGHWPGWYEMAFYYLVHLDWFHRYLGGGEPPWDPEDFLRNRVFGGEDGDSR